MNKTQAFPASRVTGIAAHLAWANLDVLVDDVEELQVMAAGDDNDVTDLRISEKEGVVTVEQPTYGLSIKLNADRWMQVVIRVPKAWKGSLEANTISGPLNVRGIAGTDIRLETVSADLRGSGLSGIEVDLKTVSGTIKSMGVSADKLGLRTVSGDVNVQSSTCQNAKLSSVSGDISLELTAAFGRIDLTTVAGAVKLYAPIHQADALLRAVTGRVRTSGVSIADGEHQVRGTTVSGDLEIISNA